MGKTVLIMELINNVAKAHGLFSSYCIQSFVFAFVLFTFC